MCRRPLPAVPSLVKTDVLVVGLVAGSHSGCARRAVGDAGVGAGLGEALIGEHIGVEDVLAVTVFGYVIEVVKELCLMHAHTVTDEENVVLRLLYDRRMNRHALGDNVVFVGCNEICLYEVVCRRRDDKVVTLKRY